MLNLRYCSFAKQLDTVTVLIYNKCIAAWLMNRTAMGREDDQTRFSACGERVDILQERLWNFPIT